MRRTWKQWARWLCAMAWGCAVGACGDERVDDAAPEASSSAAALQNRAYIVSLESEELTVIDLDRLEIIGRVPTGGVENHMAELNADYTKIYVDSSHSDETVIVDARKLAVQDRIVTGKHPAHLTLEPNTGLLAIMLEGEDAIAFVDTERDELVKKLPGFFTPHFMRFTRDGKWGYVANIGAHHLTRVRMDALEVADHIALDGFDVSDAAAFEGGFADAQIDETGTLYAAHSATGRVLVYDTVANQKLAELEVGKNPWVVFAEHPFEGIALKHLVPNFGDRTVSLIDGFPKSRGVVKTLEGDEESYGVNFSPLAPSTAFVMNRVRSDVAVVDVDAGEILERLEVGGNTETASTTRDGKYIVAAVSSANRVVVIDARHRIIKKIFENVGKYPWSVTIPGGQNYCH
jgi:YVTN family beta-propeller protein